MSLQFLTVFIPRSKIFLLQFSFQATIGRNYTGGIAVDDVTLSNGTLGQLPIFAELN